MEIVESVLDLVVQNPPETEFSAADLRWTKLGTAEHCDDAALIPYSRVDEFIIGECSNVEFPTRFHIERGRRRTKGSLKEYKDDEYLEYRMYWCSFGPENHGEGGAILPSRRYRLNTRNRAALPQSMRGCTCHFTLKRLYARPSLALIIYNERRHVNKSGFVCHGPLDRDAIGPGAKKIPYICNEIQQQTMSMIYLGIPEENVLQKHIEGIQRYCGSSDPKVDSLASQYVQKLGMIIKRSTHELDLDDEASIRVWVDRNKKSIFFYQDATGTESDPFILGIQTEWQLQQMIRFGHRGLVAADSSFGIKRLKYPLYTLLVFDSRQHALPVAWVITRSSAKADVSKWMKALVTRVRAADSGWKASGFLVDDAAAEVDPIRDIFCSQILFSMWRMRRTWLRNIVKKCSQIKVQREIFKRLGNLVHCIWREVHYASELEALLRDFADQTTFIQYFKDTWMPKLEMWLSMMKILPLASQEASGAIEAYHMKLKSKLYDDTHLGAVQRVDWLVHKLTTELHSSYWLDRYADESDSFQSVKEEYIASTSWHRALTIPDSSVSIEGEFVKVQSQKDPDTTHIISNPGSEFAFCDCTWALQGNLCKHVIKVNRMVCEENRERSSKAAASLSFCSFREIVTTLLKMPMDDSMELDKAMAFTHQMLDQIKGLVELNSAGDIGSVVNKLPLKWVSKKTRSFSGRPTRGPAEWLSLALTGPSSLSGNREGKASRSKSQKRKRR